MRIFFRLTISFLRDWSKSIGWGGPSVFEPLLRGGSCNFQLPFGGGGSGGSSYFLTGICRHLSAKLQVKFHKKKKEAFNLSLRSMQ